MARPISSESAFRALAHHTRRDILLALLGGERAAGDILPPPAMARPTLSDHLRVLEHTGFVSHRKRAGGLVYRLNADALRPIEEFIFRLRSMRRR